jgi:APA family basic amino acid/polyamine antiporter
MAVTSKTINFGEEVKNARKTLPRGIMIGIGIIIGLYLLVQLVYFKIIGFDELKTSRGIAAIVVERVYGQTAKYVFTIFLFMAVLAYVNVLLLAIPG